MNNELRCYTCGEFDSKCDCWVNRINISDVVAPQHVQWMRSMLKHAIAGAEHANNFRIAQENDMDALAEYARIMEKGCCGYSDKYVVHPDGTVYLIGFNFGH